ncbi:MAG: carboxypeptidase regulatory-like domain-containing protein [Bacteroidetes bacterium]|nr:carboxypeptidase regulatory-like domain-containing protein [Bacteroidota bacterium]
MKKIYSLLLFVFVLVMTGCETPNEPITDQSALDAASSTTRMAKGSNGRNHDGERYGSNCNRDHDGDGDHDNDDDDECDDDGDDDCDGDDGTCDEDGIVTLWAGKKYNAGTVTVTEDANNLYVTYATTGSWKLTETHLDIATTKYTKRGSPGQYDYKATHTNGVTSYTYTVPKTWAPGTSVHFLAHAVVGKYSGNRCSSTETAYGGTVVSPRYGSWFATFCYSIDDVPPPPSTYSVSGVTFVDANENGVKDAGESALANVAVSLSTGASAVSDANGAYSFSGLTAGSYTVSAAGVSGYTMSTAASVPVTISTANVTVNFGYVVIPPPPTYSISGAVYFDVNGNASRDAGELGVAGITITLNGSTSVVTDASGSYSFTGLLAGTYTVAAVVPSTYVTTTAGSATVTLTSANAAVSFGVLESGGPLQSTSVKARD